MLVRKLLPVLLSAVLAASAGTAAAASLQTLEAEMTIIGVEVEARPMVYVTGTATMSAIPSVTETAFSRLGQFLGTSGVVALGPPMVVYHDWSADSTAVDVGVPVSAADAQKAGGDVLAGMTPGGHALKVVHTGPYDDFPATYAAIDAAMKDAGIPDSARMWEVYLNEPGTTAPADLVTEIYVAVSAADAARFPGE